jgi:pimeloyl-ACP methyl ester carboxylesterase
MAAQQQGSRRGSLRPSNAAQSRSSIGGRRSSFGAAAAPAVPRACTPVNTVISQSSTFAPRSAVDWSRAWITEPRVMMRAPKPVYNTGPRPQTAPLPRKTIPRAQPPRVRLIRYSMKSTRPAVALPMSKLKRSMIKVKAQVKLEQHTVILLHGRLVGKDVDRPAVQYAPLLSQLLGFAPPGEKVSAALLECHEFWPSIRSEPKSLQLGPLGRELLESLMAALRKCKSATLVAHSLGAWLLFKMLWALKPSSSSSSSQQQPGEAAAANKLHKDTELLRSRIQRVVLISPVLGGPWLAAARGDPTVLTSVRPHPTLNIAVECGMLGG